MDEDNNDDNSLRNKDSDDDTSFVTKVRSRVSGLFNSSISRLFGNQNDTRINSTIRQREEDDLDDTDIQQPPRKKSKPSDNLNNYKFTTSFNDFIEPTAGPSGIIRQHKNYFDTPLPSKQHQVIVNADKDSDSGESTSGYSSMARLKSKEKNELKSSTPNEITTKRLFNNTTIETPNKSLFSNQSLSPQFKNTSLSSRRPSFNQSNIGSPNLIDRTITTSRILNSPFYNGPTTYGGSSAYDRKFGVTRKQQLQNSIVIKPINKNKDSNSSTSLSKTARRILDTLEQYSQPLSVNKIPLNGNDKIDKSKGLLSKYIGANPYKLNKELMIPTVPELLKMKQKQKLQETTDKLREIVTTTSVPQVYKIPDVKEQKSTTNKMKNKVTSIHSKAPSNVVIIDEIVLNHVVLDLPEDKLPKFDLVIPPLTTTTSTISSNIKENEKKSTKQNEIVTKTTEIETKSIENQFKFSKPLIISTENLKTIIAINNFKFSEPLRKNLGEKLNNGDVVNIKKSIIKNDPLMEKFKPKEGTWECSMCLVRNKSESKKCIACETLRNKQDTKKSTNEFDSKPKLNSFGDKFKLNDRDEWECTTCLVRNKKIDKKCLACGGTNNLTATTSIPMKKIDGFGDKFKPPTDSWECQICLIRNKGDAVKCAACETPNSKKFHKEIDEIVVVDTWKCNACLIRNKMDKNVCEACDTPKNKKTDKWDCPTCMVQNKNEIEKCPCCETVKPGCVPTVKTPVNMFNFGLNTSSSFNFGIPTESTTITTITTTPSTFTFGNIKNNEEKAKTTTETFTFGIPTVTTTNTSTTTTTTPMFPFGTTKNDTKTEEKFSFGNKKEETKVTTQPTTVFKFGSTQSDSNLSKNTTEIKPKTTEFKFNLPTPKPDTTSLFATQQQPVASTSSSTTTQQPTTKNGGFNFGNSLMGNNQAAIFSFGTSTQNLPQSSSNTGFNMTAPSSTPSSGGFNFNPPSFDGNAKPSFNFTGGAVPTFAASPSEGGGVAPVRKFRKAVRRTAQR